MQFMQSISDPRPPASIIRSWPGWYSIHVHDTVQRPDLRKGETHLHVTLTCTQRGNLKYTSTNKRLSSALPFLAQAPMNQCFFKITPMSCCRSVGVFHPTATKQQQPLFPVHSLWSGCRVRNETTTAPDLRSPARSVSIYSARIASETRDALLSYGRMHMGSE